MHDIRCTAKATYSTEHSALRDRTRVGFMATKLLNPPLFSEKYHDVRRQIDYLDSIGRGFSDWLCASAGRVGLPCLGSRKSRRWEAEGRKTLIGPDMPPIFTADYKYRIFPRPSQVNRRPYELFVFCDNPRLGPSLVTYRRNRRAKLRRRKERAKHDECRRP